MGKVMQPIVISRRQKHEAEQAIKDLQARGFEIVAPLREVFSDGKEFSRDRYKRHTFIQNTPNSCWMAKLRRVAK